MGGKRKHVNPHPKAIRITQWKSKKILFVFTKSDISGCQFQSPYNLCRIYDHLAGTENIKLQDELVANNKRKAHILTVPEEKEEEVDDDKVIKGEESNWS